MTELLERLNKEITDITVDQVGYTAESAITFLGNAFSQMLRCQTVLEKYNKELLTFAQGREMEFPKAVSELFGLKLPHDASEHLDQLTAAHLQVGDAVVIDKAIPLS